jgi:hypothetical protein
VSKSTLFTEGRAERRKCSFDRLDRCAVSFTMPRRIQETDAAQALMLPPSGSNSVRGRSEKLQSEVLPAMAEAFNLLDQLQTSVNGYGII